MHWKTEETRIYFLLFPYNVGALMQKGPTFFGLVDMLCLPAA